MNISRFLMMAIGICLMPTECEGQNHEVASMRLGSFLDRFERIAPGYSVTVVSPDKVLLRHTKGFVRHGSTEPVTSDTQFYVASQTKAFIGLLATRLDHENIIKLDDTIADHWPSLKLPGRVNPAEYRLRDLLTHQVPIDCACLTEIAKYVAAVPASQVPGMLERHSSSRAEGFKYSNVGYLIWAAILESSSGRSWQSWLDEYVLRELQLNSTSVRSSDYQAVKISWRHTWLGQNGGWSSLPPKSDPVCHAAGGLFTTANDLGRFLQFQLLGDVSTGDRLQQRIIESSHAVGNTAFLDIRNYNELPVTGYALGWNVCDYKGHKLFMHGGGIEGARSEMAFSPDLQFGIAVSTNSDTATGWLCGRVVVQYLQFLLDDPKADLMANQRVRRFRERVADQLETRRAKLASRFDNSFWGDWSWNPLDDERQRLVGNYASMSLNGIPLFASVTEKDEGLRLQVGELEMALKPARPYLFAALATPLVEKGPVRFVTDSKDCVSHLVWDHHAGVDIKFVKVPDD